MSASVVEFPRAGMDAVNLSVCARRYPIMKQPDPMREPARKLLLSIVELGGYPDFTPLYEELGYAVAVEKSMRKAISFLKKTKPAVIVAEFNFQSDFRDRTSSLESLLAVVQRLPEIRVIIFYDLEYLPQFNRLLARLPVHAALPFPVDARQLKTCLTGETATLASTLTPEQERV